MDAELKRIIKKIQKLYRLAANAGSEDEAQNAAMHAREMLEKYDLTLSDIEGFTEENCAEEHFIIKKKYLPAHIKLLANAMALLFQCQIIVCPNYRFNKNRQAVIFIGVGADAIVASQTMEFLLQFAAKKARERGIIRSYRNDYFYGLAHAVLTRVLEMRKSSESAQENALVPLKNQAIEDYMGRNHPNLQNGRALRERKASFATLAGARDGQKASLDRQVESARMVALQ